MKTWRNAEWRYKKTECVRCNTWFKRAWLSLFKYVYLCWDCQDRKYTMPNLKFELEEWKEGVERNVKLFKQFVE